MMRINSLLGIFIYILHTSKQTCTVLRLTGTAFTSWIISIVFLMLKVLGSRIYCHRKLIVNLASLWGILLIYYGSDCGIWLMYFNDTS